MNCADFERPIALYVENDLPATESEALEEHLRQCDVCQAFVADLCESQSVFKSIREDMPSNAEVLELRRRVLSEVGPPDPPGRLGRLWMPRIVVFASLALVIFGGWWMTRLQVGVAPPPVIPVVTNHPPEVSESNAAEVPVPAVTKPPRRAAQPARRSEPSSVKEARPDERPSEPLTVKLLTDDPNIIIYWLIDEKGD